MNSELNATNGGTVQDDHLASLDVVDLNLDGTGTLPINGLTRLYEWGRSQLRQERIPSRR